MSIFDDSCSGSFVKIKSDDLIDRVNESLAEIKIRKDRENGAVIEAKKAEIIRDRNRKRNSLWSKIFGYKEQPMPTDEEILASTEGDGLWFSEHHWIEMKFDRYEEVAYRLLRAAKHADEVYVSTTDLERLL